MFAMQAHLNESTNGEHWVSGITKDNKKISWNRCIYMEACEAIDSFPWKHWKDIDSEPDWANIAVEFIDIWHFIISEAIASNESDEFAQEFIDLDVIGDFEANKIISILEEILILAAQSGSNKSVNNINNITRLFFSGLSHMGIGIDKLYSNYMIKNQLNIFRQNNGYKDGSYIKIWDAVEDNVVAFNIMEEHPSLTAKQFYDKLQAEYDELTDDFA